MFHAVGICHPIPVKGRVFHKHVCPVLCYRIVPTAEFWFAHPLFFPKYIYSQTNLVYFKRWGWPALLVFFPKRCLVGGIRSTFRQITEIRFSLTSVFFFFKQLISVSATSIFLRSGCWTRLTWVLSVEVIFCLTAGWSGFFVQKSTSAGSCLFFYQSRLQSAEVKFRVNTRAEVRNFATLAGWYQI